MKPVTSLRFVVPLSLVFVLAWSAQAGPRPRQSLGDGVVPGGNAALAKAGGDTTNLMASHDDPNNGPGEPYYYGDFEDAFGNPDWNGWTHRDLTQPAGHFWTVSNYNQPDIQNHAAWCGDIELPSCDGSLNDPDGGYGNNWNSLLEFRQAVPHPAAESTVTITATLINDTEPGYDYTHLSYRYEGLKYADLQTWEGAGTFAVSAAVTYQPADYVEGTDIVVAFRFTSDTAWSDEDCLFPSAGACQVDDINVHLSNGAAEEDYFEDFEHGGAADDFGLWSPALNQGVGDFAKIWIGLEDLDLCATNYSPQAAFIDDGNVVPGTGSTSCVNWCYGPGGYIVNHSGGLLNGAGHIHNAIESPVMGWPEGGTGDPAPDGIGLAFSVFRHEDLTVDSPGIFYTWAVRSADTDGSAGSGIQSIGGQAWEDRNFIYYGGPDYFRFEQDVTTLMNAGRDSVQLQLAVYQPGMVWCWGGCDDGTPAPYFDDVTVKVYPIVGPAMSAKDIQLAQDAFPAVGHVDMDDPGALSVRFDMALNIAPAEHLRNDPGDSLVVSISSLRAGAGLEGEPQLHYFLKANPVFDPYRTAGLPAAGAVAGRPATNGIVVLQDKWAFDLPDTGFLFPGDVLHYYISAVDAVGGPGGTDPQTAMIPADTTGFSTGFDSPGGYDPLFAMRALPIIDGVKDVFIDYTLLFINDGSTGSEAEKWYSVFERYGMRLGLDYDIYHVNGPSSGVGNGIGGRANLQVLSGYTDILYTAGNLEARTLANGDYNADPGDDVGVLTAWVDLPERDIFLAGDGLAGDLDQSGAATSYFLGTYMGLTLVTSDVRPYISNQVVPRVAPDLAGDPRDQVFNGTTTWLAYGGCPVVNRFDGVEPAAGAVRSAEFLDPGGSPGYYPYAAVTLNRVGSSRVVSMPMDLGYVMTDPSSGAPPEQGYIALMEDVFHFFDILPHVGDAPPALPDVTFGAENHPNPFNPKTTITYALPRSGHLKLNIYDVSGKLVKTLVDEVRPAGAGQSVVWDGTDNLGSAAASGIYFYEARAAGEVKVGKMTLLK